MALSFNPGVVLSLGIIGVLGVLALPSKLSLATTPISGNTPIPAPPPLPCNQQSWWNADRVCLTWTAPRNEARNDDSWRPSARDPDRENDRRADSQAR
jgi:hypothetical protein